MQILALIVTQRGPVGFPTLIICPAAILGQWANEIKAFYKEAANINVLVYHKTKRRKDPEFIRQHDIVLTSYQIAANEAPTTKKAGTKAKKPDNCIQALWNVSWWRVVLDECQKVKNHETQTAVAAFAYRACRRWCLSGTPIQNRPLDLLSYYKILRFSPFMKTELLKGLIKKAGNGDKEAGKAISLSFDEVSLRRTKGANRRMLLLVSSYTFQGVHALSSSV